MRGSFEAEAVSTLHNLGAGSIGDHSINDTEHYVIWRMDKSESWYSNWVGISATCLNASINRMDLSHSNKNAPIEKQLSAEMHTNKAQQIKRSLDHSHSIDETFPDEQTV